MEQLIKYKQYLEARKLSFNYYNVMKLFVTYLHTNNLDVISINQETITEFFNKHSKYSISTRNQFIKAGRSFYSFLGVTSENNEWYKIKLLATERKIPNYLTEEELNEAKKYLITYHSKRFSISKIEALLDFIFYTGVRKSEVLKLGREDFNLEESSAKVYGKGKKERIIYYPENVKNKLIIYFDSEAEEKNAFNITLAQLNYLPKVISKYLGKNVYLHLLRHSGARMMIKKGLPIGVVSKILGHSSLKTTMIYTDPDEEMIKNMYKEKMK